MILNEHYKMNIWWQIVGEKGHVTTVKVGGLSLDLEEKCGECLLGKIPYLKCQNVPFKRQLKLGGGVVI